MMHQILSLTIGTLLAGLILTTTGCQSTAPLSDAAGPQPVMVSIPSHTKPYFYVVAADPQLLWKQQDTRYWKQAIEHINRLGPDFVIVCGDLIQGANEPEAWNNPETVKAYDKLAELYLGEAKKLKSGIPIYHVAGNHDVSLKPTPQTIAWYKKHFGEPYYTFTHKKSLFVVLESNLLREEENAPSIAKAQMQWLKLKLKETANKGYVHKTAYMHHPMCLESVDEKSQYFNIPLERRMELLKLFHEHNFKAVFCGHYHRNAYVKDGNLELITTSSCCVPLGKDKRGFRIVKVFPTHIEHEYYAYEDLPERVILVPKSKHHPLSSTDSRRVDN